ncbi:MAG: hypothetical protein WCS77_04410 [Elusimicrobiaceae bacterium]
MGDSGFRAYIKTKSPKFEAWFVSRAAAIRDMVNLADKYAVTLSTPQLNAAFTARLMQKPYTGMGTVPGSAFGPNPDLTIKWLKQYRAKMPKQSREKILLALREQSRVFAIDAKEFGTLDMVLAKYYADYHGDPKLNLAAAAQWWKKLNLAQRNAILSVIARKQMRGLVERGDFNNYHAFSEHWGWDYLSPADRAEMLRYLKQLKLVYDVRYYSDKVPRTEMWSKLNDKLQDMQSYPIDQQASLISQMFDNDEAREYLTKVSLFVAAQTPLSTLSKAEDVAAVRSFDVERTVSPEQNDALVSAIKGQLPAELSGTAAGARVMAYFSHRPMEIAMEQCSGCYAKFEPAPEGGTKPGRIVINTALVQHYMNITGLKTTELLASPEEMNRLVKFLAPLIVHEGSHQLQRADSNGRMLNPYVQEDEVESGFDEASFVLEKYKKDPAFAQMVDRMKGKSAYLQEMLSRAASARANPRQFIEDISNHLYAGLPDIRLASAQIVAAANDELERREGLGCDELARLEKDGLAMKAVSQSTMDEFFETVGDIKTSVLEKVRAEFMKDANMYDLRNDQIAGERALEVKNL